MQRERPAARPPRPTKIFLQRKVAELFGTSARSRQAEQAEAAIDEPVVAGGVRGLARRVDVS